MKFEHGHKTLADGTRQPLTKEEAEAIWQQMKESEAATAARFPDTVSALRGIIQARGRLEKLGWQRGGGFIGWEYGKPDTRNQQDWVVIEEGSTGIFYANRTDEYFCYDDCVSSHQKVYAKLAADLTDDERQLADRCLKDHLEWMKAFGERMAKSMEEEE